MLMHPEVESTSQCRLCAIWLQLNSNAVYLMRAPSPGSFLKPGAQLKPRGLTAACGATGESLGLLRRGVSVRESRALLISRELPLCSIEPADVPDQGPCLGVYSS